MIKQTAVFSNTPPAAGLLGVRSGVIRITKLTVPHTPHPLVTSPFHLSDKLPLHGGLGGCFWLQISHKAAVKLSSRNASPLKAQTGLENFFQTHSRGCGQTTVPSHVGCLPGGYVSRIMGTGDQREKERDQGGNHHPFIT